MAKIYETKEDLVRDQLSRELDQASNAAITSSSFIGGGIAAMILGLLKKKPVIEKAPEGAGLLKRAWHNIRHEPVDLVFLGGIVTGFSAYNLWSTSKRAKHAQSELEKLGPETVIFPPMETPKTEECLPCKLKAGQRKSLLEYAARPDNVQQVGK